MIETMEDAQGAGLAAPQVHVPLRLFVFRVPPGRTEPAEGDGEMGNTVVINPQLELLGDEMVMRWEGCLSIPGLRAAVPRHARVRYAGMDNDGHPVEALASGFHAGVVQHEYDHLDGILYPMRMSDFRLFGFNEEMARGAGRVDVMAPERSGERDAAIEALLPLVPLHGWTVEALRQTAGRTRTCCSAWPDAPQTPQMVYDRIELPPVRPDVTRVRLFGGRCACCGERAMAPAPDGLEPGSPFGTSIEALVVYLHYAQAIGFERLRMLMDEVFGLSISEGAISNILARAQMPLVAAATAIATQVTASAVIVSAGVVEIRNS